MLSAEEITAVATAVTAVAVIAVPFAIEYRRRVHLARQPHGQEIRSIVLEYLRDRLVDFYGYVLERRHGLLEKIGDPTVAQGIPSAAAVVRYKYRLRAKDPQPSLMAKLTDQDWSDERRKKFLDLYADARDHHYREFFRRWDRFNDRFRRLGELSMDMGQTLAAKLEEQIKLPHLDGSVNQQLWADYAGLALFLYEWVWCSYPQGGLNVSLYSERWQLTAGSMSAVALGSKDQMEMCRSTVDRIATSENAAIQPLIAEAKILVDEANSLKRDLERLLVSEHLSGSCPNIKVPFF